MKEISAQLVQELRRRTGAGMMACKTVLQQTRFVVGDAATDERG